MADKSVPPKKRNLRVTKWLGMTPAVAACSVCSREFKAPLDALRRVNDAQVNLQEQFNRHHCQADASV
jgi:hypothetical protein